MKTITAFLVSVLLFTGLHSGLCASTNSLAQALQLGLFEEEAHNNLDAAIQAYKSVVGQFDRDRKLAATAIYRLGECYRKQNKTNEAVLHYERIIREFPDVTTLVNLSRQNLAGLGAARGTLSVVAQEKPGSGEPAMTSGELEEIKRIRALIQNSPDLINAPVGGLTPLHTAASAGRLTVAKFLLENGAMINLRSKSGDTPLHLAAMGGHRALVQLLLQHGADKNAVENQGATPLHHAALQGFQAVVQTLVEAGADVNARNQYGWTPLSLSSHNGHEAVVEFLLGRGADPNLAAQDGGTPLTHAVEEAHYDVVGVLLKNKANVNAQTADGKTPLIFAMESLPGMAEPPLGLPAASQQLKAARNRSSSRAAEAWDIILLLLNGGANPNLAATNAASQTSAATSKFPLMMAVKSGNLDLVSLLMDHKADPNQQSMPSLKTPLIEAITASFKSAAILLLTNKANVNLADEQGNTALHYSLGQPEVFDLLLRMGAQVNAANRHGVAPLHWAVCSGLTNQAVRLIDRGANVNLKDKDGYTPLHVAVLAGRAGMLELLLSRKANPNLKDTQGRTPLDLEKEGLNFDAQSVAPGVVYFGYAPPGRGRIGAAIPMFPAGVTSPPPPRSEVAELLRSHGALDVLPDFNVIQVTRPGQKSQTIFTKGTNDWNRFTLLELIGATYGLLDPSQNGPSSRRLYDNLMSSSRFAFPELSRVRILRFSGKEWTARQIDVRAILHSGDCSKDVSLEWGDAVEIPEADHVMNQTWTGFPPETLDALNKCWSREITVTVKGQSTNLVLSVEYSRMSSGRAIYDVVANASFWIKPVLQRSGVLLASSDLNRVKVTRTEAGSGVRKEYILDCSEGKPAPEFWLRHGDVIEVPDR